MARAAVKAKQAARPKPKPQGRRKHASGGNPNQQLFFVRMRRRAKPAYFILAFLFAATFAFLGVGSGSSGLNQLFNNINIFGGGGTSISSASKAATKHPTDPTAWRKLATAYESHNDTFQAVSALRQYTSLRPKDAQAWNELAGLQMTAAQDLISQYRNAYAGQQLAAPSQGLLPSATSPVGKALGTNPIEQAAATSLNASVNDLAQRAQTELTTGVASYKKIAQLRPHDPNAQFQLAQAAQSSGDTTTAVTAYKAYLRLNPNGSTAAQVRSLIKRLTTR